MFRYFLRNSEVDSDQLATSLNINPITAKILASRGLTTIEQINNFFSEDINIIKNYEDLPNVSQAVDLILQHKKDSIRIIGDYDVDGVCATYILIKGLHACGIHTSHYIPHRINDGYGLNKNIIQNAIDDGVQLIITCDNGVAAFEAVELARKANVDILITDHHEIAYQTNNNITTYIIPNANVVVDPKLPGYDGFQKDICGAFVALRLISALAHKLNLSDSIVYELAQFAAIATVCDVMPVLDDNRHLVKYGLRKIEEKTNPGLTHLMIQQGIVDKEITIDHLGYTLGPCINAAGRLDSAETALKLLLTENEVEANMLATTLMELNDERKNLTTMYMTQATQYIEGHENDKVLVVVLNDCHEGVVGILAGKLKDIYNRPVIVLSVNNGIAKGSSRSIEAYNIYDELLNVSDILIQFGGHAQAAGLTIKEEDIEELRKRLNDNCKLEDKDFALPIIMDAEVNLNNITLPLIKELEKLGPFGEGNPKPKFLTKDVKIKNARIVGKQSDVLQCEVEDSSGYSVRAVCFNNAREYYSEMSSRSIFNIIYSVGINVYKNFTNIQLTIEILI